MLAGLAGVDNRRPASPERGRVRAQPTVQRTSDGDRWRLAPRSQERVSKTWPKRCSRVSWPRTSP